MQNTKMVVRLDKSGFMRYLSHLDFIRLIYRALRRADIPYVLTEGFNPRPKVKFGQALKVGKDGEMEVTFFLRQPMELDEFRKCFQSQLTEGISIGKIGYYE
ncbi:MAG: TIGR03936 family radical SAM-associated protein [Candidatus Omnitrophota bacterium]